MSRMDREKWRQIASDRYPHHVGELDHSSPLLSFLDEELVEFGGSSARHRPADFRTISVGP
jgi:hypothetical protein